MKTTNSAAGYIGANYEGVIEELEKAGFENIGTEVIDDLTSGSELQDGDVGEISINGDLNFAKKAKFVKDAQVLITYHTIRKIQAPLLSSEAQEYDYIDLAKMFQDAGFTNVEKEAVFDLAPASASDYKYQNYKEIIESLEGAYFT